MSFAKFISFTSLLVPLVKNINILKSKIELFDDGHFLIIKLDLMLAHDAQQSRGAEAAQVFLVILKLSLDDSQHPKYGIRIDDHKLHI
jgi:hypothetical protein